MPRKRRAARAYRNNDRLTANRSTTLMSGLELPGGDTFGSPEEMRRAWWLHRAELMAECRPLSRPFAYWAFEVDGYCPTCKKNGYEAEGDALLRLKLELTPEERSILTGQEPTRIPEVIPTGAVEHWAEVLRSLETRRDWHQREGRTDQARAWGDQAQLLLARLVEAGYCPKGTWPPDREKAVIRNMEVR